jgi:16S rRNA processing protein RimM
MPEPAKRTSPAQRASGNRLYSQRNRTVTVPAGYLAVGFVLGVHGLRGELKVELYTDFPERFTPGADLYLGEELVKVEIVAARMHQHHLLLRLAGVASREQADALRNRWLFVDETDAVELADGLYWVHDIVGLDVQDEAGVHLGTIREVLFTGANEVYIVETPPTVNNGHDLLLPAIDEVVRAVDLDANRMTVRLLPGLLD